MQTFDRYFRNRLQNADFKTLYDAECNVCVNTVGIFEKADLENISMECLARDVAADVAEVEALREADRCDPILVMHLCRRLGLRVPQNCPKLNRV